MTCPSTRTCSMAPGTRRPVRRCRIARVALVFAWVVFWVNTALFPCCEALAAAFDGHSDSAAHATAAAGPAHHSGGSHTERQDQNPSPHCATLNEAPAIDGVYAAPLTERVDLEWLAIATPLVLTLTTVNQSASLAPSDYLPPPPFRRYLRTQRLLI